MNTLIKQIEKGKPFFDKIARNMYIGAIRDGFLTAMPVILFSSIFILLAAVPEIFGYAWPEPVSAWLWKVYGYSMGIVGLLVAATTARCLTESVNRKMPDTRRINATSTMLAAIVGFLLLTTTQIDGGVSMDFMGTKGILVSFIVAFLTVNIYKFCVLHNITIKMPKEVPGTISQTFKDVFPFAFSVFAAALLDLVIRQLFAVSFAEAIINLLQPLFSAADGYLGLALIYGAMAFFWFVGVHGPSIVEPAIAAIIYVNVEANLQMYMAGEQASNVLTTGLGHFLGTMGGTGATLVVPYLFMIFAKSKQLKAVGKASFVPVSFGVNEPVLFAAPMILNPYFLVPFLLAPIVNVWTFKFFVDVLGMNSFMYVLPWATPAPIGIILGTGMGLLAVALTVLLLVVDSLIYLPFIKAYDASLVEEEALAAAGLEEETASESAVEILAPAGEAVAVQAVEAAASADQKDINVLVLCAGAGTSAMLANALKEGAESYGFPIKSAAGAYGSHYDIMENYDVIVLAPQVNSYYEDIKEDSDRLGIKLLATKGAEYIKLTRDPKMAVDFIMAQF